MLECLAESALTLIVGVVVGNAHYTEPSVRKILGDGLGDEKRIGLGGSSLTFVNGRLKITDDQIRSICQVSQREKGHPASTSGGPTHDRSFVVASFWASLAKPSRSALSPRIKGR